MISMSIPARCLLLTGATCLLAGHLMAAELHSETVRAWERYVRITEARIERDLKVVEKRLVLEAISSNNVVVWSLETVDGAGKKIPVPKGRIHHWRGAVLIPKVMIEPALQVIRNPLNWADYYKGVLESGLVERNEDFELIYLKLRRSQGMVEAAYNTENRVQHQWHGETFASSTSIATRIAEIVDLGKDTEHEKPEGNDRGFLWRLNVYWKYRQVEEGLLVECETLTLSRDVPLLLRFFVSPLIARTARNSMAKTLESLRNQVLSELVPEN